MSAQGSLNLFKKILSAIGWEIGVPSAVILWLAGLWFSASDGLWVVFGIVLVVGFVAAGALLNWGMKNRTILSWVAFTAVGLLVLIALTLAIAGPPW